MAIKSLLIGNGAREHAIAEQMAKGSGLHAFMGARNPGIIKLAIIDDSIVRGTTSKKIIEILRKAGAKEVHFLVTCPPIKYPCYYAIDMPTNQELIASEKNIDEIKEHIDADSLTYQELENIPKAIGLPEEKLCMACLNGNYPTEIKKEDKEILEKTRRLERGEE